MNILNDPRVTEIDGSYRVINDEFGPLKVLRDGPDWAAFFDSSTAERRRPQFGMYGSGSSQVDSGSSQVEETVEWALRTQDTTEVSR